ncbi:acyltransferase family protein [Granulosicoccus antarcticus]|uniref:Acyltransferase 3 domain-containing protein n=1 Tax=Granulosicoccus antarcticus IMCC3135 TaxID=1192854 RepID=A0A2Z2NSL9_9GAMM|nr:acyltransferase family protein [Granulosicoccus antarcticus]ASJ74556.1 hypothetical protein IMCC3135_22430 [Granulosicoccus antarcticus IMCC3135]
MKRIIELDAFRGLAALAIVFSHILVMLPEVGDASPKHSMFIQIVSLPPFRALWGGSEAVVFFFVLSGFVLAMPFYHGPVKIVPFLIKRFIRIYPAYIVAVALSWLAYIGFASIAVDDYSQWFHQIWPDSIKPKDILGHVLLVGSFDNDVFNPVLWTLVMEMRIALIFPVIMWLVLRYNA